MEEHPFPTPWRTRPGGLVLVFALIAVAGATLVGVHRTTYAGHNGLLFPAPAGQVWQVCCGYNTATHSDADGGDRHALDLVRVDGPTAGSKVLAPISGRLSISRSGSSCLIVQDSHGMRVMMCHVYALASLRSGQNVITGQEIGAVAPAGEALNNGLAHIHLAVHRGFGGTNQTIPFVGEYALDGIELPDTTAPNAYAGQQFVSTNEPRLPPAPPPPASPFNPPAATATGHPTRTPTIPPGASVVPNGSYTAGVNGVVVLGGGGPAAIASRIAADSRRTVQALWVLADGRWSYYLPAFPSADGGLRALGAQPTSLYVVLR